MIEFEVTKTWKYSGSTHCHVVIEGKSFIFNAEYDRIAESYTKRDIMETSIAITYKEKEELFKAIKKSIHYSKYDDRPKYEYTQRPSYIAKFGKSEGFDYAKAVADEWYGFL